MKFYIAGKITGFEGFKERFQEAADKLASEGHTVMNPSILPPGFSHSEYMHICYAMIDVCEAVYMLDNWKDSKGAKLEHEYAMANGKKIIYQEASERGIGTTEDIKTQLKRAIEHYENTKGNYPKYLVLSKPTYLRLLDVTNLSGLMTIYRDLIVVILELSEELVLVG